MHKTMRKSAVLKGAVAGIASIAMLMSVSVTANAADTPSYGSAVKPNITSLLGEYYNWWTPKKVVNNTPQGDAFRGKVTDAGKSVLGQNDKTVVAINNKAAADTTKVDGTYTQAERAALDASDGDALRIYKDAFGPIIGQYVAEGVAQGELPKTSDLVFSKSSKDSFAGFVGTGSAKKDFNYPRPYFNKENEGVDRTIGGDTDLNGLSPTLDIKRIPMIEMTAAQFRQVIDVDLNAPFIVAKAVIPDMIEQGGGKIINICSMMSELGRETVSAYAAAKGGLKMLTKNIASEYGKYNIQCNGIGPGYIATPQTAPLREIQPDGSRHPFDQFIVAKTPAERWGKAEDLGGPAVFLASEASDFVNGLILYVDGGILAYIGKQPG